MPRKTESCRRCGGSGHLDWQGKSVECHVCIGTGRVPTSDSDPDEDAGLPPEDDTETDLRWPASIRWIRED